MSTKEEAFLALLKKYGLENRADINYRLSMPDSGVFLVPLTEKEDQEVEFPFEFLFELDCLLRRKNSRLSQWLWRRKLTKPRKVKDKKMLRCFCFKIESAITIAELHARIRAKEVHFELANLCYE